MVSGTDTPASPSRQTRRNIVASLDTLSPFTSMTTSPASTPAVSAGPPLVTPATTRCPSYSVVIMPSHGRPGLFWRP